MIIELAAMPEQTTLAFVKSLYAIMLAAIKKEGASSEVVSGLKKWGPAALPLINRFKLSSFPKIYKQIAKTNRIEPGEDLVLLGKQLKIAFSAMNAEHDIK